MKRLFFFLIACFSISFINAQQGIAINTDASQPNASAMLDIKSTTKGFLLPRMTSAQRSAIPSPATGLQVYQTDGKKGFYYYNGSVWVPLGAAGANLTDWSTTGNAAINPATNFIGTTDAQPFIGKANDEQVFRFSPTGTSTIIGYQASKATLAGGAENHIIGLQAGFNNTGFDNHFDGYQAGYKNTSGYNNQFIGFKAGYSTTSGTDNLFIGALSGYSNTAGSNHFIGNGAGYANTTGTNNHFNGFTAGESNTTGSNNHFEGYKAGFNNKDGSNNHYVGYQAGFSSVSGKNNFMEGNNAGYFNLSGDNNYFSGNNAGKGNITGDGNVFTGNDAGISNTTGSANVFTGYRAGYSNTSGYGNVIIGNTAGYNNVIGHNNVFIGENAGSKETGSNRLYIGSNDFYSKGLVYGEFDNNYLKINGTQEIKGFTSSDSPLLTLTGYGKLNANIKFQAANSPNQTWLLEAQALTDFSFYYNSDPVLDIIASGNLVVKDHVIELSDRTLKTNINPIQNSLQKLLKLNGYTYNWKDAKSSREEQIGLIAQEVETQFPQLVYTNKNGIKGVAYTHMVPVLVQSIKEQQKMIDELKAENAKQQKENAQLAKDIAAIKTKLGL